MLTKGEKRVMLGMLALLALALVLLLAGCKAPAPVVITQRDSTHTERVTTYRDTVIKVPGDRAVLKVGA
ncbi:MAG: hypothetical protein JST98_11315, partial [Bacteroidetes bacterium]|nr:hypothetical protein [Bacteroidota bacterium]